MAEYVTNMKYPGHDWRKILQKNFAASKVAKAIWDIKTPFFINKTMKQELNTFILIFNNPKKFKIEMPIAHYVRRTPDFRAYGDACLDGAGGYSDDLGFWFFLPWPQNILNRTLNRVR